MKSFIIKSSGEIVEFKPKNKHDFSLAELKEAIGGGYIEIVRLPPDRLMVVDEEGKIKEPPLPVNVKASHLYCHGHQPDFSNPYNVINGDALVCHDSMIK